MLVFTLGIRDISSSTGSTVVVVVHVTTSLFRRFMCLLFVSRPLVVFIIGVALRLHLDFPPFLLPVYATTSSTPLQVLMLFLEMYFV